MSAVFADRLCHFAVLAALVKTFVADAAQGEKASAQAAAAIFAGVLPQFLAYPFVGPLIDMADRRRLLVRICAVKAALVLTLLPLLWFSGTETLKAFWPAVLAIFFLLNLISVAFAPARTSAVPDVTSDHLVGPGAGLITGASLLALLAGFAVGTEVCTKVAYGPTVCVGLAAGLLGLAAVLFYFLPEAVSMPGLLRKPAEGASAETPKGFWAGNMEGLKYVLKTRGVTELIAFDALFWLCATVFFVLLIRHVEVGLHLGDAAKLEFLGFGIALAGLGLISGAFAVGKASLSLSPILTFPSAIVLIGVSAHMVFSAQSTGAAVPVGPLYPWMFTLGLAGGALLGRIDADLLHIVEERIRGRVFAFKGFALTGTVLTALLVLWLNPSEDLRDAITQEGPRCIAWFAIPAFAMAWMIDCGLFADKKEIQLSGPIGDFMYWLVARSFWVFCKLYFGYSIVGMEKIPRTGGVILAANHGCFLDPVFLACKMKRKVYYLLHAKYYRSFAHPLFRLANTLPVEEGGTLATLKSSVKILESGLCLGIFPEGHVCDDGKLQKPQGGMLFLAQRANVPVIPVALKGNVVAYPRHQAIPSRKPIKVIVGEQFSVTKEMSKKQLAERADQMMADLAKVLECDPPPKSADDVQERKRERKSGDKPAEDKPPEQKPPEDKKPDTSA